MRKTKYIVKPTTQFKKDYKLALKRRLDVELLENIPKAQAEASKRVGIAKDKLRSPEDLDRDNDEVKKLFEGAAYG